MTSNIREPRFIFREIVKNKNFMTPVILEFISIPSGAVELSRSEGNGLAGCPIYGVTVVKDGIHNGVLSKCFHDESGARNYIQSLKGN
jgi:hypothetical protein